ncbi:MAG TPA: MazG nucleotide pyrophosphohydrolase domain-containing protein, partial [Ilumatobacteraceae bacterium]|nr:MazG nucleotide pyrophosphohydrolase domain-containing protein [Ilumatobacteraceae bacterium]
RSGMAWDGTAHNGFTTAATAWLETAPVPLAMTVAGQADDPHATLATYRELIALRHRFPQLHQAPLAVVERTGTLLVLRRADLTIVANLAPEPVEVEIGGARRRAPHRVREQARRSTDRRTGRGPAVACRTHRWRTGRRHPDWDVMTTAMDLAELQAVIETTFGERDRARGVSATVAWLAEEVGELAQAVRKGTHDQRVHEFGDVIAWVATLANQVGVDLTEAIDRYRTGCPRCQSSPCACP